MPEWLPVLIFIFASILIIDCIGSYLLWKKTSNLLFKKAAFAWGANFINFMIHGVAQSYPHLNLIGHSFYFITACFLTFILCDVESILYKKSRFLHIGLFMLVASQLVYFVTKNYMLAALVIDIAIASPLGYYGFMILKNHKSDFFSKLFSAVLILNAFHFLDYPFLYDSPKGSLFGFSTAFLISIVISVLLPLIILQMNAKTYTTQLEKIVVDRTASLMNRTEQLEQTIKDNMALVSIVSHDISSPIMIIKFSLDKLKKKLVGQTEIDVELVKIDNNLKAVSETLSKVKEIHATKLGKIEPVIELTNIELLVLDVVQRFQPMADEKNIKIVVNKFYDKSILSNLDPLLFKNQILGNLVSNAIKFSNTNSNIEIDIIAKDESITLDVTDYGKGIEKDKIVNLFDFNKNTTTAGTIEEKGTGLGLPTVKLVTEKMNGNVYVFRNDELSKQSLKEKVGTTFSLSFKKVI